MRIVDFGVEQWMNAYETTAVYNIAETCVDSLTLSELLALSGEKESALEGMLKKKLTYGDIPGSLELRTLVSGLYRHMTPENVLIASGGIGANFLSLFTLIEPGDHVVAIMPTYQQLYSLPAAFGAKVDLVKLRPEDQFLPDLDLLRKKVTPGTKAIVLNNPNNPTGALIEEPLMREIVEIARSVDAYLLCDEVYRGLEHEKSYQNPSVVDLYEKGISTGSVSKVYSLAGLRLGWIVGPKPFIQDCFSHRDYTTISCGMLDDYLGCIAIGHKKEILARNLKIVSENLEILDRWVASEPRIFYVKPKAGTTAFLKYDAPLDSKTFCKRLFELNGTFVVPGSCFEYEGWFRLGYAPAKSVLEAGLYGISQFLKTL